MAIEIDSWNTTQVQVKIRYPEHDVIHATEYDLNVHKKRSESVLRSIFSPAQVAMSKKSRTQTLLSNIMVFYIYIYKVYIYSVYMYIYICIYIYMYIYICIYTTYIVYIYIERERVYIYI